MRTIARAVLAVAMFGMAPAYAADRDPTGQMVVLKANQIGQIFCLSRLGNDEAVISGILTDELSRAIAAAEQQDTDYAKKHPDEKPPLGDGIPWQSSPDYAAKCDTGLVTLSRTDAKVEIKYGFPDAPGANFTDTLILRKIPLEGMNVGYWRIDDVVYPDGTDLKTSLVTIFETD
jgi:hypothetical protein